MSVIRTVHWDEVEKGAKILLLVWPGPMDRDVCFEAGGFTDFKTIDGDDYLLDQWDLDFRELINRVVDRLKEFGDPRVENGMVKVKSFFQWLFRRKGPAVDLVEQLEAATSYHCPDFRVHFGDVSLRTGNEHPLFIIELPNREAMDGIVRQIARGWETRRTKLDWSKIEHL